MKFLGSFREFLQGDCFAGNLAVCAASCSIFVACGAHARRYMFKALGNDKKLATVGMQMWNDLFQIERDIDSLNLSVADIKKPPWVEEHAQILAYGVVGAQGARPFEDAVFDNGYFSCTKQFTNSERSGLTSIPAPTSLVSGRTCGAF